MKDLLFEHLHDKNRETLLFIAGKLSAFDSLWGGCGVSNQKQAQDYDPDVPQKLYVQTEAGEPSGEWLFEVSADETVEATYLFNMGDDDEKYREDYTMTVDDLLKWARSQPPRLHEYATFLPHEDSTNN